jgi:hypothetical protein
MSDDDTRLLRTIASGIVKLNEAGPTDSFTLPYPADAQRGLDQITLECLLRGEPPPQSLPDLITWCAQRPVREWPLHLPGDEAAPGDRMVEPHTRTPTQLCYEWALRVQDTGTELYERQVMLGAMSLCRGASAPESYTAFRRLLIEQPVLIRSELALLNGDPDLLPVIDLIREAYRPAPAGLAVNGEFAACARCRCLLVAAGSEGWWCEQDRCRGEGQARIGNRYRADADVLQLARPLRIFVTGPGRAEIELEQSLSRLGLHVEMWPEYDAYDLRVHLPHGNVWAVDVKDRASPALLGRDAAPLPAPPSYDAGFLVVPHYRFRDRRDYREVFRHHCPPGTVQAVTLSSDRELVRQARRIVQGEADA